MIISAMLKCSYLWFPPIEREYDLPIDKDDVKLELVTAMLEEVNKSMAIDVTPLDIENFDFEEAELVMLSYYFDGNSAVEIIIDNMDFDRANEVAEIFDTIPSYDEDAFENLIEACEEVDDAAERYNAGNYTYYENVSLYQLGEKIYDDLYGKLEGNLSAYVDWEKYADDFGFIETTDGFIELHH